jgi:hypothetical protein
MPLWKSIRILALVVLTGILAWTTYPTWEGLVAPPTAGGWTKEDVFGATITSGEFSSLDMRLISTFVSTTETGNSDHVQMVGLEIRATLYEGVDIGTITMVSTGKTTALVDECLGAISTEGNGLHSFDDVTRISREEARADGLSLEIPGLTNEDMPIDATFFRLRFSSASANAQWTTLTESGDSFATPDCYLPADRFWTTRGSRSVLATPTMYLDVLYDRLTPSAEILDGTIYQEEDSPYNLCLSSAVSWGVGVTPGAASPPGRPRTQENVFGSTGVDWPNCVAASWGGNYVLYQPSLSIDLTDNLQSDQLSRNIFFAGAFAGILGALAIEIINGGFDLAEAVAARRRADGVDEEVAPVDEQDDLPDAAEDPDPWSPNAGGYL